MHMFFEHLGVDKVLATQLINLLFADELVLIINHLSVLFFKLFRNIVDIGHPLRPRSELRDKETSNFRVIQCGEQQSAIIHNCKHVNCMIRLNTCEKGTLSISNFDLFLVAE